MDTQYSSYSRTLDIRSVASRHQNRVKRALLGRHAMKTLQEAWSAVKREAVNAWYNEGGAATEADCEAVETALEGALEAEDRSAEAAHIERATIIRLIKAHAKSYDARGGMSDIVMACGLQELVSEIEDARQHDCAHVDGLENPPVKAHLGGVL